MKEMKYIEFGHEMIIDRLQDDEVPLYNIPHTCLEDCRNVKEAIRDSLTGEIVHSEAEYYASVYYIDVEKKPLRVQRRGELMKGLDVAQWVMERLPAKYGTFAIMLRPKEAPQDVTKRRVWVFMAL